MGVGADKVKLKIFQKYGLGILHPPIKKNIIKLFGVGVQKFGKIGNSQKNIVFDENSVVIYF